MQRDCLAVIRERRSIREFSNRKVDPLILKKLVEYGNCAPSAGNLQARDFVIVTERKDELAEAALGQKVIREAPAVIVVCANIPRSSKKYGKRGTLFAIQDASIAAQNILLAAHALGLGACWVGAFKESMVSEILGLPEGVIPVAMIAVGYPKSIPPNPGRVEVERLIHWGRW
ncbi:MAG: nitroreductase family protein [Archaeoglobi archaeon]|nr:nitroreductase family protein [Candidatus Mnemosynella sp.]